MGKHEPMTAKAIGKRIKSKGLQKLKFYCQMCQKQCRDANGFKCHLTSEAHQRQLLLFAENPNRYMDEFSSEFMKDFLHLLKRRYSTKRVLANQVYQEYIKDRHHLHMNSTRWCTLTGFVKWMGRKGICHVENNEKGWFITYIDRDPETLLRNENKAKKEKLFRDDDERHAKLIQDQIERGKLSQIAHQLKNKEIDEKNEEAKQVFVKENDVKLQFSLKTKKLVTNETADLLSNPLNDQQNKNKKNELTSKSTEHLKKKSALDEIMEEEEERKARRTRKLLNEKQLWTIPGIIVRINSRQPGSKYYQQKGRIEWVESSTTCMVKMLNSGEQIRVNECHLETVIPAKEKSKVKIVRGPYYSEEAIIVNIDQKNECVLAKVEQCSEPIRLNFDDISKIM